MALPLLSLIASLGSQAAGNKEANDSTVEGAKAQAEIERQNRIFQQELFDKEMANLAPYYELGTNQGLPLLAQFINQGGIDQSNMPLYNMQLNAGMQTLGEQGINDAFTRKYFTDSLNAAEGDASYSRLNDLLQIGMGSSESAGAGAANFATNNSNSLIRGGNALSSGLMNAGNQRQSMYSNLAGQMSSLPAMYSQYSYLNKNNGGN